jgi:hypothetical protein
MKAKIYRVRFGGKTKYYTIQDAAIKERDNRIAAVVERKTDDGTWTPA